MNATNLAIVFAPNLIRPKVETIDAILMNSSSVNKLIYMLIFHYEQLFLNKPLEEDETEEITLSPHLITLKAAQEKAHAGDGAAAATTGADVPPPTLATPPASPAGATGAPASADAKPSRRKLGARGRTQTSSASLQESKAKKKGGHAKEKSADVRICSFLHCRELRM
jgi:hypothetical protein